MFTFHDCSCIQVILFYCIIPSSLPEFANIHPFVHVSKTAGYNQMFQELEADSCDNCDIIGPWTHLLPFKHGFDWLHNLSDTNYFWLHCYIVLYSEKVFWTAGNINAYLNSNSQKLRNVCPIPVLDLERIRLRNKWPQCSRTCQYW